MAGESSEPVAEGVAEDAAREVDRVVDPVAIRELIHERVPNAADIRISPLGADEGTDHSDQTEKGFGYGKPLYIAVTGPTGQVQELVFHTESAGEFGHDRRSDRAHDMLLAADTYRTIPRQVAALDVGAITEDGRLRSLADTREFYLLTEYAPGSLYADDLRRIARAATLSPRDRRRGELLADYLVALHEPRLDHARLYRRAVRDLLGHGEGIFGLIDGYPDRGAPGASIERLRALEAICWEWRWRLRDCEYRLTRTHGDFHPFNILFDDSDRLSLLDASRGCMGDAADDVSCLVINYAFFALEHRDAWAGALRELWYGFFRRYLDGSRDDEVLEVLPPFFAWRALVLCNPTWYPAMSAAHRDALLGLTEDILTAECFDPECVEVLFA